MVNQLDRSEGFELIRPVIESIADLVCAHGLDPNEDGLLRSSLLERGFNIDLIRKAEDWCDVVSTHSRLVEVLCLFLPEIKSARIYSKLEKIFVSDSIWKTMEECRNRGIFSMDMIERLLEGVREMDTRDWDDIDVRKFIETVCGDASHANGDLKLRKALNGDFADYYC
ncbi:MAG: DUF494 family protein [Proteobacteria bacterium]|nr:DUF494 family protein [Pseudomonadota bacterium]